MPNGVELQDRMFEVYNCQGERLGLVITHDSEYATVLAERTWPDTFEFLAEIE